MFKSPSPVLKVEFQGGESLLNFSLIRSIVEIAEARNQDRDLEFVIATNLAVVTDEMLDYCREHESSSPRRSTARRSFTTETGFSRETIATRTRSPGFSVHETLWGRTPSRP